MLPLGQMNDIAKGLRVFMLVQMLIVSSTIITTSVNEH